MPIASPTTYSIPTAAGNFVRQKYEVADEFRDVLAEKLKAGPMLKARPGKGGKGTAGVKDEAQEDFLTKRWLLTEDADKFYINPPTLPTRQLASVTQGLSNVRTVADLLAHVPGLVIGAKKGRMSVQALRQVIDQLVTFEAQGVRILFIGALLSEPLQGLLQADFLAEPAHEMSAALAHALDEVDNRHRG